LRNVTRPLRLFLVLAAFFDQRARGVILLQDTTLTALFARWIDVFKDRDHVPLIGISGAQGSGKSTLARALAARFDAAHFSLDDVYVSRAQRGALASSIHPLFATRGVPLTHDLELLGATIAALERAKPYDKTPIPAFDKRCDNPFARDDWPQFVGRPKAIIIEGWCLGATPITASDLALPCNDLERDSDADGHWRKAWNDALAGPYQDVFNRFDAILFLAAPSFDVVLDWRCQQEETLLGLASGSLDPQRRAQIKDFIRYFERLTRHMLAGGQRATARALLGEGRDVVALLS
jgi:D-glycerate 3-kinase